MEEKNTLTAEATLEKKPVTNEEERRVLNELAIDDAATAMKLEADDVAKIKQLCGEIMRGEVSQMAVKTIMAGLSHDTDVKNAEGEGYIRGRNEKIELENHFDKYADSEAEAHSVVPRFARRSIWDIAED